MSIGVYRASIIANVETPISTGTRNCKHQITDWSHEWQTVNRKSIEVVENELFQNSKIATILTMTPELNNDINTFNALSNALKSTFT